MLCDDPRLTPVEFLRAVMHSPDAPLIDRVSAAKSLLEIEGANPPHLRPPSVVIRILLPPALEMWKLWESFSPEMQADLLYLKRCYDQGNYGPFDIADMPVKGRG